MSARTRPTTGQKVQWPPNQLWTAEYHSSVVGRKTKPMIGQRIESKTPRNQWVKNQRTATTNRGAASASRVMIQGIGQILPWFFTAISPALFVREVPHSVCTPIDQRGNPWAHRSARQLVHLLLLVEQLGAEPLCLGDSFHLDGNRIHGLLQL